MKTLVTICAAAGVLLAVSAVSANNIASSTMHFEGALIDAGGGVYTGTIDMTAGTYYMPGGPGTVPDGSKPSGYATPDGSDAVGGFDVYAKQGATSYYDGGGVPPGDMVTRQNVDGGVIGADHDGYGSPGGGWGAFWSPNVPDWNNYQLTLTATNWSLEYKGVNLGTPMSGAMNWSNLYAAEDDIGSYTGVVPGDPDANSGFAATMGGGPQAWDMDWTWGSEAIPLELLGFDVTITDLGAGQYHVTLTPASGNVQNVTQGTNHADIQSAIDNANPNNTIEVLADHAEGQVVVDKSLTIKGGSVHTISMTEDTGNSGDARAWFLVNAGVVLDVEDLIFDGNGYLVYQAFRIKGSGSFTNCGFQDIKYNESGPDYAGLAIVPFGDGPVDVIGCTFEEIGRVGVLYFGSGVAGSVFDNNTYTGKGDGDWLDYCIDLSAGATATITQNRISHCRGVASVDGSTSAGILITTYYGAGTIATLSGSNIISANTVGLAIGYDDFDTSVVTAYNNSFVGNTSAGISAKPLTTVDAENNWWGDPNGPGPIGSGAGDGVSLYVDYDPWLGKPAHNDVLYLEPTTASFYVQPTDSVIIDMNVANLQQKVNGCQAMLGYSSTYLNAGSVAVGGGPWDLVIWESWAVPGELDTAIGVDAQGAVGTDVDGTVATLTLTPTGMEGTTKMVFRPDADPDPGLTQSTFLSDMNADPVWPAKVGSAYITIDGTDPVVVNLTATQDQGAGPIDVLDCANTTLQGTVNISVDASDALAGLASEPAVTVTQGMSSLTVTYVNENPAGTFNYTVDVVAATANGTWDIDVTATDKAGNSASTSGTLCVNKNEIDGTVAMGTSDGATPYSFDRDVVFKATDGGGAVLKTWTVTVSFTNDTGTQIASGSYALTDVPTATTNLSAKTAWALRTRKVATLDGDGQATVDFTGGDKLRGGDIKESNSINILDFSVLKINWATANAVADVNGNGLVEIKDFMILVTYWFQLGDAE